MADFSALLQRMRAQRGTWVDLLDGRRVLMLRPPELELPAVAGGIGLEVVAEYAADWSGFTEATLLGAKHGSGDAVVPFHRDLWRAYAADHAEEFSLAARGLKDAVERYLTERAATAKNSEPSST